MIDKTRDFVVEALSEFRSNRLGELLFAVERAAILEAINICDGNKSRMAAYLGVHRNTIRKRLIEFGLYEHSSLAAARYQKNKLEK